jgi:hypothetical protein
MATSANVVVFGNDLATLDIRVRLVVSASA